MYHCTLSAEDQQRIRVQRYHHPDPVIRKRLTILWHKHHGLPHHEIAQLSSASPNTVTTTIRTYIEEGLSGVEKREFYQPTSQIDPYFDRLMVYFSEHPPRTLKEAKAKIEQMTGKSFSLSHVRNLLLSMGLSKKKREAFQAH